MNNQNTRWHDLIVGRLKDGGIRLEQRDGLGEPSVIHLHPEQLVSIARQCCGMKQETSVKVAELERRISVLTDKIQDFVCSRDIRDEILNRTGDGLWMVAKLDALLDLALEFDGGRLEPEYKEDAPATVASSESARKREGQNDQLNLLV